MVKLFPYYIFLLLLVAVNSLKAQQVINYTIDDGLPSNMVYCVEQDDRGFIWFGTDTGLSRFDGVEFRNFGLEDGLPDIEIINFFKDSQGRIWLYTINGKVGFIKGDSIYSSNNLPILKELDGNSIITSILEHDSKIYFSKVKDIVKSLDGEYINHHTTELSDGILSQHSFLFENSGKLYLSQFSNTTLDSNFHYYIIYEIRNLEIRKYWEEKVLMLDNRLSKFPKPFHYLSKGNKSIFVSQLGGNKLMIFDHGKEEFIHVSMGAFNPGLIYNLKEVDGKTYVFTDIGVLEYDWETEQFFNWNHQLEGSISLFQDDAKNLWCSSIAQGVYLIKSNSIENISKIKDPTILASNEHELLIGTSGGEVFKYQKDGAFSLLHQFNSKLPIESIYAFQNGDLFYNTVPEARYKNENYDKYSVILEEVQGFTYVAFKSGILAVVPTDQLSELFENPNNFVINRMAKTNALRAVDKDSILLATEDGLFAYSNSKFHDLNFLAPAFKTRIISIEMDQFGNGWFLNQNKGVLYLNDSTVTVIDNQRGLSSNITNSMLMTDSLLWVGTRNGLNRININDLDSPVLQILEENGLPSGNIRDLEFFNDSIFVLTPNGISKFSVATDFKEDPPRSVILRGVRVDQEKQIIHSNYTFSYENSEVEFSYSAINFGLQEGLIYRFQLKNLDNQIDNWNETSLRKTSFYNLRPGQYIFEIQAKTKNSDWSKKTQVFVDIQPPYWQTLWFQVVAICLIIAFSYIGFRISRIRKDEKEQLDKERIGAEIKALKAQINPHFLFNALSSIQHFIVEDEKDAAEDYLSQYSRLIRKVLDHSERLLVPLHEEIETLKLYVKIEQLRTNNKFDAFFTIEDSVDEFITNVPSMIIQPFIENSIWHGIKSLDYRGKVEVKFYISENNLNIEVKDNGVGFSPKESDPNKQGSFGMKLVEDRIKLLKRFYQQEFTFSVESNAGAGTVVRMAFPSNL